MHVPRLLCASLLLALCTGCAGTAQNRWLLAADRIFDGERLLLDHALLIEGGLVVNMAPRTQYQGMAVPTRDLGDATLLPGFIEPHAHMTFRNVPPAIVLRHGVTTVRDLGGPALAQEGGTGSLRRLSAGPLLTPTGGYPVPGMGSAGIAWEIDSQGQAVEAVNTLAAQGVNVIKVALEPGAEPGAPWTGSHHGHTAAQPQHHQEGWPLFSVEIVRAIVAQAGAHGLQVVAHVGEQRGVEIALDAGVQQWAHVPCSHIPLPLLERAVHDGVRIVTTTDTLSRCPGVLDNLRHLAAAGADLHYGSEIGHEDVPWGINGQELVNLVLAAEMTPQQAVQAATARNGQLLGLPLLGTLQAGAPADIIAVAGNPLHSAQSLKALEYPALVVSGGQVVVDIPLNRAGLAGSAPPAE